MLILCWDRFQLKKLREYKSELNFVFPNLLVIHMFFCGVLLYENARPHQAVKSTRIAPVSFKNSILHHTLFKIGIVHIGNLKFTAS